jgi:hypothetical protein
MIGAVFERKRRFRTNRVRLILKRQATTMKRRGLLIGFVTLAIGLMTIGLVAQTSVTTYHYDNNRTGWNKNETVLTPANVWSPQFGLLYTVTLNDQVDAQPLLVSGVVITAGNYKGTHDVVYVATENNTVYAIDAHSGTVLLSPSFGVPVPMPLGCNNNGPNVGINSTPVIDLNSKTLYVMVYTNDGPTYRLHALDLGSLTDNVTPQVVTASHTLTNGTTFTFNAKYQRQRPALLLSNGNIYAGFGSFCDFSPSLSRGWLLGWTAGTLAPFPHNELLDTQATDSGSYFLSSIWMSGYGPAADDSGNVLFVTGNSDKNADTYDGVTDIQESVVKVSPTLTGLLDHFTPSNQFTLDRNDTDFGSGGVLVLPDQPGSVSHMAVAAGKDGNMYLMNEDNLGGFSPTKNNVLGTYSVGNCWCGESYYVDATDGLGRVVSSGGAGTQPPAQANSVEIWKVQTTPTVALTELASAQLGGSSQDPGFFTTISSNGNAGPIIWAISRPYNVSPYSTNLLAFDPDSGGTTPLTLLNVAAGKWSNLSGNANLVPVVANGQVYVASNQQLQVFGLTGNTQRAKKTATVGTDATCDAGTVMWGNPAAVNSPGIAFAAAPLTPTNHLAQCIYATGFHFSIPATATILGIGVSFDAYVSTYFAPGVNYVMQLLNGGSPVGDKSGYLIGSTFPSSYSFGGLNNLWGKTWTPSNINQSNFGVSILAAFGTQGDTTANLDDVQITVFYTP